MISYDPAPIIFLMPSEAEAKAFSDQRIAPTVRIVAGVDITSSGMTAELSAVGANYYTALQTINGEWGFRTPTRKANGYPTQFKAQVAAAAAQQEDRQEAEAGAGPIAAVLRKHFNL